MGERLLAEEVAAMLQQKGLPVTAAQVRRLVPGQLKPGPRKPVEWRREGVERWMERVGLNRKRHLVKVEQLAQLLGRSYWTVRRTHDPFIVVSHNCKWYEAP